MVEHRRFGNLLPHLILLVGVAIVAFPVYLAVIASTHDNTVIANGQMPLYPGAHGLETYWHTIVSGTGKTTRAAGRRHDAEQPDHGARHRGRQNRDLDHLGLCDRVLRVSVPDDRVLDHLHHADAAGRGAHLPDLQDHQRPAHARHLCRADPAADRVGHRDAVVPPVLHDDAERAGRGLARSTAPARSGFSGIRCCRCR